MSRRSKIDTSPNSKEIEFLLIEEGWGTRSVARYLELKYNETIPASSLRTWRARRLATLGKSNKLPDRWKNPPGEEPDSAQGRIRTILVIPDEIPDVMSRRIQLAQIQEARIKIDMEHEVAMGKLFSTTAKEIDLLNRIWDSIKEDMQDLGLFPRQEGTPQIQVTATAQAAAVTATPSTPKLLAERIGVPEEALGQAARALIIARRSDGE